MIAFVIDCAGGQVRIEGQSEVEVIEKAAFFGSLPSDCPDCGASVRFFARHPQGFDYYGLCCTGVDVHEATFGVHRDGRGLFYRASEPWRRAWAQVQAEPEPVLDRRPQPRQPVPAHTGGHRK